MRIKQGILRLAVTTFAISCMSSNEAPEMHPKAASPPSVEQPAQVPPRRLDPSLLSSRSFGEAPMLTERVKTGDLPPVSERLPENPLVIVPVEHIGRYGGTLRRALTGDIAQAWGISKTIEEGLMGYERPLPNSILPEIAESHVFQDDGRTAIVRIRKGIKWSDGVPFTVDDILFWYHDMTVNDDARNGPFPSHWLIEGKPIRMEKVDDHTLKFGADVPMGRLVNTLASGQTTLPKHRFAHLHPKYNPQANYQMLRDSTTQAQTLLRPGVPRLSAWVPVEWTRGQRVVYERNPYYFKVDSAGNQLPYADRIVFNVIQDTQVILLKFINGEIDLFGRYSQLSMYPTLRSEEHKGKFELRLGSLIPVSTFRINFDTHRIELREAFRNLNVRKALSHAMNREEISAVLYHGLLEPAGFTFAPTSKYYSHESAQTYANFDPDKSRQLLDEAGYRDSDGDGFREFKDGSVFSFTVDVIPGMGTDICQLVADHWKAVGINVILNIGLRDILWPRWANGTFEIFWWWTWSDDAVVKRSHWGITGPNQPQWHRNAATEGPQWLHEATRLMEEIGKTVDTSIVRIKMNRIRDLHTVNAPILIPGFAHHVWGASTRLGNVPQDNTSMDGYSGWSRPVFHEQIYIR
jgi:peptide/nickel transport system substrate-binding protein